MARLVSETREENSGAWKQGKSGNLPRMVMVVTKIDLLPTELSPTRLEHWVRQRAREDGAASKMMSVHMVSAVRECRRWSRRKEDYTFDRGASAGDYIRVEGILPGQGKLCDTPGLLHPHQITTRLTREEQKLVHISKELRQRTYSIKAGHTVHIAVLMRLDIEESSVDSIYITVWGLWTSPYLPLHMGKTGKRTDNARRTFWPSVAGFTVSKIVSKADQALNKRHQNEKKRITESYSTQKSNTAPGHGNYC